MPQYLPPTQQILKATKQINCHLPLNFKGKCPYKYCKYNSHSEVEEPQNLHLDKLDKYWSEFLRAQKNSSANYLYKIRTYGEAHDPTLVKKEPVPWDIINQRLLHMPYVGGLLKQDTFYLLSFLLNFVKLPAQSQKIFMDHMLKRKLIDMEIINYLRMVARHQCAGLTNKQLKKFLQILQYTLDKDCAENLHYYNPEHIFIKNLTEINPYELEYLKEILHSKQNLTAEQTMYLAKLVYKLQGMDDAAREEYLQFLREKHILTFNRFEYLIAFLVSRAKRVEQKKLKKMLKELEAFMDIGSCEPEPKKVIADTKKPVFVKVDYTRIRKALNHLMSSVLPNIVRLIDLKNFLNDMMVLSDDQVADVFNSLKIAKVMSANSFNYIEKFINSGRMGKLDKHKQKAFIHLLKKAASAPLNRKIMLKLNIPAGVGPIRQPLESKALAADNMAKEVKEPAADLAKTETEVKNGRRASKEDTKSSKTSGKQAAKKSKKKTGKK